MRQNPQADVDLDEAVKRMKAYAKKMPKFTEVPCPDGLENGLLAGNPERLAKELGAASPQVAR